MVPSMARNTIDFGIDLGTTNSEIAFVDKGQVHVIRNGFRDEITPSAVRIDRKGSIIVGKLAFNQRVDDKENTHTQFKRLMGSQQILEFPDFRPPDEARGTVCGGPQEPSSRRAARNRRRNNCVCDHGPSSVRDSHSAMRRGVQQSWQGSLALLFCKSLLRRRSLTASRPTAWTGSYLYMTWAEEHSMHR